jgi:hypothetical protein
LWRASAAFALAVVTTASQAVLISAGSNNPLSFSWSFNTGLSLLTGFGSMTFSGFNSTVLTVATTLTNTAALSTDRLTSFGFGINPNSTSIGFADVADGGMVAAGFASGLLAANVPGVEICAFGGVNCGGGGTDGIFGGASDTFIILLGGTWGSSVNVDPIGLSYQSGLGGFAFPSSSSSSSSGSSSSGSSSSSSSGGVPEPASTTLVGMGLLLLAASFALRRHTPAAR